MARQAQRREPRREPRRERKLEPNWVQIGMGTGSLAVSVDWLARPLWTAWRSGSWETPYREPLRSGAGGRQARGYTMTTPHEALSGLHLVLALSSLLIGVALLWLALRTRRSIG